MSLTMGYDTHVPDICWLIHESTDLVCGRSLLVHEAIKRPTILAYGEVTTY